MIDPNNPITTDSNGDLWLNGPFTPHDQDLMEKITQMILEVRLEINNLTGWQVQPNGDGGYDLEITTQDLTDAPTVTQWLQSIPGATGEQGGIMTVPLYNLLNSLNVMDLQLITNGFQVTYSDGTTQDFTFDIDGAIEAHNIDTAAHADIQQSIANEASRASLAEQGLASQINQEAQRATQAETNLQWGIDDLHTLLDTDVVTSVGIGGDSDMVQVTQSLKNLNTGLQSYSGTVIPTVSVSYAGVMDSTMFVAFEQYGIDIEEIYSLISSLPRKVIVVGLGDDPSQQDLTDAFNAVYAGDINAGDQVISTDTSDVWIFGNEDEWIKTATPEVALANESEPGLAQHSGLDGCIGYYVAGVGQVNGWSDLKAAVAANVGNISSLQSTVSTHTSNAVAHITALERTTWNGKQNALTLPLPVANGGTGLTTAPSMLTNLATATAASPLAASPRPGVTGILPVANGGTGKNSLSSIESQIGTWTAATVASSIGGSVGGGVLCNSALRIAIVNIAITNSTAALGQNANFFTITGANPTGQIGMATGFAYNGINVWPIGATGGTGVTQWKSAAALAANYPAGTTFYLQGCYRY